jgi:hypothetical protein
VQGLPNGKFMRGHVLSSKRSAAISGGARAMEPLFGLEVYRRGLPLLPLLEFVGELLVFV